YFCRLFKRVTGMSPSAFLLNLRINRARTLLANSDCTIEQIAKSVGYREPKVFSKIFKKINRLSPSSYRDDCNNFLLKR
ncbi:MAG: helix-turn-helix transcriptional regulator, partial [bacterium]|nr:helix-turn-helix transcriptional regulator [bacterium]